MSAALGLETKWLLTGFSGIFIFHCMSLNKSVEVQTRVSHHSVRLRLRQLSTR